MIAARFERVGCGELDFLDDSVFDHRPLKFEYGKGLGKPKSARSFSIKRVRSLPVYTCFDVEDSIPLKCSKRSAYLRSGLQSYVVVIIIHLLLLW
jgi:hypothetical protein